MKLKIVLFSLAIFIIFILIFLNLNGNITLQSILNPPINSSIKQSDSINSTQNSITVTPSVIVDINSTWPIPSNDYVINHINWSLYPDLQTGYVRETYLSEPNEVIHHKFIESQISIEVKTKDNWPLINSELSSVAREARASYGPNSAIDIVGTVNGVIASHVYMLPYDDNVYDPSLNR